VLELLRYFGLPTFSASTQGPAIDNINVLAHWLMALLFVGWGAFFIYTLFRFRASKNPKADYQGIRSHFSSYLEVVIGVIEVVLLLGFAIPIWASRVNDVPKGPDAVHIRVVGQQFAWNIHYPGPDGVFGAISVDLVDEVENPIGLDRSEEFAKDDIFTVNQLHIPVNTPINISLSTKDVIHSFTLTELRVKQDAIPGMEIPVWFEATMTTDELLEEIKGTAREGRGFEIACAQLCGLGHYRMKGFMTIHEMDSYEAWLAEEQEYLSEEEEDDWEDDWED